MKPTDILLLDLNPTSGLGDTLRGILRSSAYQAIQVQQEPVGADGSPFELRRVSEIIACFHPDVVFLVPFQSLLEQAHAFFKSIPNRLSVQRIILVMEAAEPTQMRELFELGVADLVTPPLLAADILPRLARLLQQAHPEERLTHRFKEELGLRYLVGESAAFLGEIRKIPLVAQCAASVLISGETGTGKELCARAIHYLSPRTKTPFIPLNCGAIPVDLVENELFGHERGAFTGAATAQPGLIQEADGGTLFLDEIDCLPLLAQVKLLRFLQEKEYRPLGSTKLRRADARIIAATNASLEKALEEGRLRRDLYYRLNIIPLMLPPLRERREDIPLLARHFLTQYADEFHKPVTDLAPDAIQRLMVHDWPGNIRELEHVIERAVIITEQTIISRADIILSGAAAVAGQESFRKAKEKAIMQFEKAYIQSLLVVHQGNITKAAQAAQKNRRAFWQLMHKHSITKERFKPRPYKA